MTSENENIEKTEDSSSEVVESTLTEEDKKICNYVNEKVQMFITGLKNDVYEKGFKIDLKVDITFAPIGQEDQGVN